MGILIVHDEMGIYLGNCMGMGFWTLLDPVGQPAAVVFDTEEMARDHVRCWDDMNNPDLYRYVEIEPDRSNGFNLWASISVLKAAGLGSLLGSMEEDSLLYANVQGTA